MEHRHLLPDEFDLLVDGEEGFGVAPLVAHVDSCATCRAEVEARRNVVAELEHLPRMTPSPLFAYHVMREVQVFEPWYASAWESARRFLPRSGPERALAGTAVGLAGVALTVATVWLVTRLDVVLFLVGLVTQRVRGAVISAVGNILTSTLGAGFAVTGGGLGVALSLSVLFLLVIVAAFTLRAVTSASRRRSS